MRDEIKAIENQQTHARDEAKIQEAKLKTAHEALKSANEEVLAAQAFITAAEVGIQTAEADERASSNAMQQSVRENQRKAEEAAAAARGKERDALWKLNWRHNADGLEDEKLRKAHRRPSHALRLRAHFSRNSLLINMNQAFHTA